MTLNNNLREKIQDIWIGVSGCKLESEEIDKTVALIEGEKQAIGKFGQAINREEIASSIKDILIAWRAGKMLRNPQGKHSLHPVNAIMEIFDQALASIKKDIEKEVIGKYETASLKAKGIDAYTRDKFRAEQRQALERYIGK